MPKRRVALTHRKQRSVLTDMLPFEVPPTFSNRGFYSFLKKHRIEFEDGSLQWAGGVPGLDATVRLLFGLKADAVITSHIATAWGSAKARSSVPIGACRMDTIPFNFRVAHKLEGRTLSVVHPRNQVQVASFYANHSALIIYYTSLSPFSIRRPVSVSQYAFFKDKLHQQKLETIASGVEEEDREYEQLGSYFVYRQYRNIHRFFESYKYHRCEKKYDAMVQIDVSKCFDSIYTHSLPWAVIGKAQTKFDLEKSKFTFGGRFDALMQNLNHKETNGIVIGPEFSRIFAEIILQSADLELEARLKEASNLIHKTDYEIFRYVDDYFVFYNQESTKLKVIETLQETLKAKKLNINPAKMREYSKPIITEITIAKERVSSLLNLEIDPVVEEGESEGGAEPPKKFSCPINSNRLIIRYKAAIKESKVEYGDLLNYSFAIIENKIERIIKCYLESDKTERDRKKSVYALQSVMEFAFFAFSASPKVNHTIRICRMISTSIAFLSSKGFSYDLKHILFKYIHDNIMQQLEKNTMGVHREVENMYLLIGLSGIGKEYWLPEKTLAKHFLITTKADNGEYDRVGFLSHFSITVLLSYIKNKKRYNKLRQFIEAHSVAKLEFVKAHCANDAEALILLLDMITCPYIADATKAALGAVFGLDAAGLAAVQSINDHWFTAWADKFDLAKELDAKRSREVY